MLISKASSSPSSATPLQGVAGLMWWTQGCNAQQGSSYPRCRMDCSCPWLSSRAKAEDRGISSAGKLCGSIFHFAALCVTELLESQLHGGRGSEAITGADLLWRAIAPVI